MYVFTPHAFMVPRKGIDVINHQNCSGKWLLTIMVTEIKSVSTRKAPDALNY